MKKLLAPLFLTAVLLTACGGGSDSDKKVIDTVVVKSPNKDGTTAFKDAKYGEELWLGVGAIAGVEGVNANGIAQSNYYSEGTYLHTVQMNIEQAPKDHFYEGWLVKEGEAPISTGPIKSRVGDVRHAMSFEITQDLREYTKAIITLEPDDGNPAPAAHVAEGTLQTRNR